MYACIYILEQQKKSCRNISLCSYFQYSSAGQRYSKVYINIYSIYILKFTLNNIYLNFIKLKTISCFKPILAIHSFISYIIILSSWVFFQTISCKFFLDVRGTGS